MILPASVQYPSETPVIEWFYVNTTVLCHDAQNRSPRPVTDPSMGCRLREDLDRGTGTIGLKNGGQRRSEISDHGMFLKTSVYRRMYKLGRSVS
jgi:hypothetical protein